MNVLRQPNGRQTRAAVLIDRRINAKLGERLMNPFILVLHLYLGFFKGTTDILNLIDDISQGILKDHACGGDGILRRDQSGCLMKVLKILSESVA